MQEEFLGKIEMVDLKKQYLKIKPFIDDAINNCIDNTNFIKGPQVDKFESLLSQYLDVNHVITCGNGTDALQISLMALDLKPGDEIILPAFTYVATAEVIGLLGLTPVMIDVDPDTFNITQDLVSEAITKKTKLVVPVHLFGQCADMEGILSCCNSNEIFVVEDTAQAIGSKYSFDNGKIVSAGAMGDFGTTSFFPSKNLGCYGDGGAIYTNNSKLAQKVRMIANHGQEKKYIHEVIGVNSRLDTIQAAILCEKLKMLDTYIYNRQSAAEYYDNELKRIDGINIPVRTDKSNHVFHQYTIKVPNKLRDNFKDYLNKKGIPSMVYYPVPLNRQKAFRDIGRIVGDLSTTEALCEQVISLPMHTELTERELQYITDTVKAFFI